MHPLTTRCFPMGTLQRSVCWKLSLIIFFTAFLFFLDVFSSHSILCIAVDENQLRDFNQLSQENVSHKTWPVNISNEDTKVSGIARNYDDEILAFAGTLCRSNCSLFWRKIPCLSICTILGIVLLTRNSCWCRRTDSSKEAARDCWSPD